MEYESVTQIVLSLVDSMLQNVKQFEHARISWHVGCPSALQHLRCNCFDHSNNSQLQLLEGGPSGFVNNILNVCPQKEIKRGGHEIVPSRPIQRPCQEILG
jgi:hypothetical protein